MKGLISTKTSIHKKDKCYSDVRVRVRTWSPPMSKLEYPPRVDKVLLIVRRQQMEEEWRLIHPS